MKCINCGKRIKKKAKYCENCGKKQKKIEVVNEEKKSNKLFIVVIILLILLGSFLGYLIINHHNNKKNDNTEISIDDNKEIILNNYKLTISDNYKIIENDESSYIKSDEYILLFSSYPLSYNQIIRNKDLLLDELKYQGYSINKIEEFEKDNNYILLEGNKDELEYGFIFYEFDSNTNIFITITSNNLSHFNKNWFNEVIQFLKTSEKIEK